MSARVFALLALLSLAEAALLTPLVWLLVPAPKDINPSALVGLVWLVLMGLALQWRWLASRGVKLTVQRVLMGAWLVALFLIAEVDTFGIAPSPLPDALVMVPGFLAAIVVWWRGMSLGNTDLHPRTVDLHFQIGTLLLIGSGLMTLLSRDMQPLPGIAAFFFASLASLPLANLEYTHQHPFGRGTPMTRHWWMWVFGAVIVVLFIGSIVTAFMTGKSAVDVLITLISVLLLPLFLLLALIPVTFFDWLIALLRSLLSRLGSLSRFQPPQLPRRPELPNNTTPAINLPPEANFAIAILVFAILVIVILSLMRQARKAEAAPARDASDVEGKLQAANNENSADNPSRFGLDQLRRWLAAMTIRRLYVRATREAAKRGLARKAAQTPYDFLPDMQHAFPTAEADARTITEAYVAAHYGQVPDSQAALDALRAAWERMRSTQKLRTRMNAEYADKN